MKAFRYIQILMIPLFLGLTACNDTQQIDDQTVEKISDFLGVPQWCIENQDIDTDCDGYADDTGEYIYND